MNTHADTRACRVPKFSALHERIRVHVHAYTRRCGECVGTDVANALEQMWQMRWNRCGECVGTDVAYALEQMGRMRWNRWGECVGTQLWQSKLVVLLVSNDVNDTAHSQALQLVSGVRQEFGRRVRFGWIDASEYGGGFDNVTATPALVAYDTLDDSYRTLDAWPLDRSSAVAFVGAQLQRQHERLSCAVERRAVELEREGVAMSLLLSQVWQGSVMALVAEGHNYIGHNYIGHNYIGRNYIGHNYIPGRTRLWD